MAKKEFEYEFDPVKELKGNDQAKQVIWTTKALNRAVDAIKQGLPLKVNPFIGQNTKLLKPELVFERTDEEIEDYIKCMQDVTYFASKCFVITPEGLQPIILRDYQEEYLRHLQNNRFSIFLACRQAGKSLNLLSTIKIKVNKYKKNCLDVSKIDYFYIKEEDLYEIPFYEVYNLFCKQTWLWKCKYRLYKMIYKLEYGRNKRNENYKES